MAILAAINNGGVRRPLDDYWTPPSDAGLITRFEAATKEARK
jgi:hypothetical protein